MRIFEITYVRWGNTAYAYFQAESADSYTEETKFYENYMDCKEQNAKHVSLYEQSKIREALRVKFGK